MKTLRSYLANVLVGMVVAFLPPARPVHAMTIGGDQSLNGRALRASAAHTADATLVAAENGTQHTNVGATGAVVLTLPAAVIGMHFVFRVGAAYELRIDPAGTEVIQLPSTGVYGAAGKYLSADAAGEWVKLVCYETGKWAVEGYFGTWTAEG